MVMVVNKEEKQMQVQQSGQWCLISECSRVERVELHFAFPCASNRRCHNYATTGPVLWQADLPYLVPVGILSKPFK